MLKCRNSTQTTPFYKKHLYEFGRHKSDLVVFNNPTCAVSAASIGEPSLFANVSPKFSFSLDDRQFIQSEVNRLIN